MIQDRGEKTIASVDVVETGSTDGGTEASNADDYGSLPRLNANDPDLRRLSQHAWAALEQKRPRTVFRRVSEIVRVTSVKGAPAIQAMTLDRLAHEVN